MTNGRRTATRPARPARPAAPRSAARVDALTGLPNRVVWAEALETERVRRARYRRPVVVMNVDIDGLKETNQRFGRAAGDELLRGAAGVLRRNLRDADLVARIDDDEFGVMLVETYGDAMDSIVSRLYGAFAMWRGSYEDLRLSVSIGWAAPEPFGDLLEAQRAASEERLQQATERA
ncbi:MAG TPA: GGDEF domain-containing protein [Candidatus Limnocylindria bacterium]|nr:GGDEF domain-containing protein [Candidatus Limnocylindria bacterium]